MSRNWRYRYRNFTSAPRSPCCVVVALVQAPWRYTFSRTLNSATALLSVVVPTFVETETEKRSPKVFPTMNRGSKDLSVEEYAGSMGELVRPATVRGPP